MKTILFSPLLLITLIGVLGAPFELPDARVAIHVVDQDGKAVSDAAAAVAGTAAGSSRSSIRGITDASGIFEAQFKCNGEVGVTIQKRGWYRSEYWKAYSYLTGSGASEKAFAAHRWEPWNPAIVVTVKKILQPIPMYARRINRGVPSRSEPVGFDFFEGDFVAPNGRGKRSDIIFNLDVSERAKNDYDYKIVTTFPAPMDGILPFGVEPEFQGSTLRSAYIAPESGFLPNYQIIRSRQPGGPEKSNYDPEKHAYFFRIRTVADSTGKIISANYGKIYGDFMNFTYYLNPTPNDRNIEFDPKRNLFTNLKPEEQVTAP